MVHDFYNSRYATCFAALESLKPLLAMDIHLHDHIKALMAEIKTRALVQVCKHMGYLCSLHERHRFYPAVI
jgi:hypothetical protein